MLPLDRQIVLFMEVLEKLPRDGRTEEKYKEVMAWAKKIPPVLRPKDLFERIAKAFERDVHGVEKEMSPKRKSFDSLLAPKGWLTDYVEYTRKTEPPTVFHYFAGLTILGAAAARNVYFDKGAYLVFPNVCTVLIAPSGKCRKTSACNLAVGLLRSVGGTVLADKTTPEALVMGLQDRAYATGLIYAPELAVFLGKQKYQEGMIPLLTALMDCPAEWSSNTVMRGEAHLTNVALSFLGATTMDWLQTAIPHEAFGGGFMSRLLFIVQDTTDRSFALPPPLDEEKRTRLLKRLVSITHLRGEFTFSPEAYSWYQNWYDQKGGEAHEHKLFSGYYERKPDHMIRLAMCMTLGERDELVITLPALKQALAILDWTEIFLPHAFEEMSQTVQGEELARLLRQLRRLNGQGDYPHLLRLNSNRLTAEQFKRVLETARQAGLIVLDQQSGKIYLTAEGWQ
jgi:hypothetical protein